MVTFGFLPFPPVIDQTINRVPLGPWSMMGFLAVITASGYLAYRRSPLVLGALAFAIPFAAYRDVGNTTITLEKCLVFGITAGLLVSGMPLWPRSVGARRILMASGLLLLTIILSLAHARYHVPALREFFKAAEFIILFWCAVAFLEHVQGSDRALCIGVSAGVFLAATLGVLQALVGGAPSGVWVNGHPLPRVAGPLEGPNQLAGFLEAAMPLLWVAPSLVSWMRAGARTTTGIAAAALMLTQSRAGVLMAAVSYLFFRKIAPREGRLAQWPMLSGGLFGFALAGAWYVWGAHASWGDASRLFHLMDPQGAGGVGSRAQLWPAAIHLFQRSPLTGVGAGNFELLLPSVGVHGVQTNAGSLWLQTLAEQGLLGVVALIVFAVVGLRESFAARTRSLLACAAFFAFASLLMHQLVDDLFFFPKVAALVWLMLAGVAAGIVPDEEQASPGVRAADAETQLAMPEHA
ncbi:MAG: O-antigen ligase family protein [Candidatus Eremiobacteraeota bacterium]|nr:O-antigen ligase family protein [Candidatus Eremiobacteraeota bacterium]